MEHRIRIVGDTISIGGSAGRIRERVEVVRLACSCGLVGPPRVDRTDANLDAAGHAATVEVLAGDTVVLEAEPAP